MKASIKFRDDDRPLLRAKVPVGVLGLPFLSGVAAGGDTKDLRFDLSTAFASGPALRLSYRPNDPLQPFALSVRTGLGPLGSPARAPFALAAEFNLLSSNVPAFSLLFKPRIGDFGLASSVRSPPAPPPAPAQAPLAIKMADLTTNGDDHDRDRDAHVNGFSFAGNGFAANVAAAAGRGGGGVGALLSGMRLTTRSVLPLWSKASLRFQWGLRVPPELKAALADDGYGRKAGSLAISKLPLLVMNKITIEHTPKAPSQSETDKKRKKDAPPTCEVGEFSLMKRQLETLSAESTMLRRAMEDLRAEIGAGKGEGRRLPAALPPPQQPLVSKPDRHYHGSGKDLVDSGPKPPSDAASEELKKALEVRRK
ncbi:hypothetical protein BAE44_0022019 [Dichanthelium oligosanthes]|uniref:Uncharacterized protein n=1 Tax=Dichanthelium oligosanthes TaxID=888268 RepID=A0A1E5UVV6_9POAL|nr:hypothetical protein BAE44_0022019 [Dichanthelium oligosanthes]